MNLFVATNTSSMKTGIEHESISRFSRSTSRVRQSGHFRTSRPHHLDRIMKPTLATKFTGRLFPCAASPKLDGIRAIVSGGVVLSRSGKPIPSADVQVTFSHLEGYDGELISGDPVAPDVFARTASAAMSRDGAGCGFHVFDHKSEGGFFERSARLRAGSRVSLVPHAVVRNAEELERFEADCVAAGFEGVMVRDPAAPYIAGRSRALQKLKRFEDSEAICTGIAGQESGAPTIGALVCRTAAGHELRISAGMSEASRLEWYRSPPIGALVRYRHAVGQPLRFPVLSGLRDPMDI